MNLLPTFTLGDTLTPLQCDFFQKNGIIHFKNFVSRESVQLFISELKRIEQQWLCDKVERVRGIPLKFGTDLQGKKMIQRFAFTSHYSSVLKEFLLDPRLQILTDLLAPYQGRIGEDEKDGLVVNHYVRTPQSKFTQMGWHTDCPRDLFLGQKIMPMLNVGIHLDDCPVSNGGLRVIPGTHKQNMFKLLFSKKYFVDNNPDPSEAGLEITAGDLTIHDGRIWHRVQISPYFGEKSRRRVMYIPIITGKFKPKNEHSKTPFYHYFASKIQN